MGRSWRQGAQLLSICAHLSIRGVGGPGPPPPTTQESCVGLPAPRFIHLKTISQVAILGSYVTQAHPYLRTHRQLSWEKETVTECGQGPRALWELKGSAWPSQRPRGLPGGGGTSTGSYREKRGHEVHGVGFWCSGDCREWTGAPRVPPCLRSAGPSLVSFPRSVGPRAGVGRPLAAPRA